MLSHFIRLFSPCFILPTFELHYALFFVCFAVWSVAHTTPAAPLPEVPGTVCPLTPPRCTPSLRPAAQGQNQNWGQGPAQRPVDRHVHSLNAISKWAWRQLMVMMVMMPTALRDLPTFQNVGECVWIIERTQKGMKTHQKVGTVGFHNLNLILSVMQSEMTHTVITQTGATGTVVLIMVLFPQRHNAAIYSPPPTEWATQCAYTGLDWKRQPQNK